MRPDVWLRAPRLDLRRPEPSDLHTDPRAAHHAHRAAVHETWRTGRDGLSYAAVLGRGTDEVIGWAGLREEGVDGRR